MSQNTSNTRLAVGIVIIALGSLFLLSNLDIIDYRIPDFFLRFPVILIIIGLIITGTSSNKPAGIILITIGVIFLFPEFWPVILIALGLYIIFRTGGFAKNNTGEARGTGNETSSGINDFAIFGGGKKYYQTDNFTGGKLTAIFGGSEIDLLDSKLAPGEHVLDIFAMFGGTTILIPTDWKVEIDIIPLFGGFSDKRRKDPNLVPSADRVLKIKGIILFGGGEIKN